MFETIVQFNKDIIVDEDFIIFKNDVRYNLKDISCSKETSTQQAEECFKKHSSILSSEEVHFIVENKHISYLQIDVSQGFKQLFLLNLTSLVAIDLINV